MIESGITPTPAPDVPVETVKLDDNAPPSPPTPIDGSPSRDGLKPSDTESNGDTEAKVEELTATALLVESSPTIQSAEPPLEDSSKTPPTTVAEPTVEPTEHESSSTKLAPLPASSPNVKPQEEDHTSPESKDERSAEARSVADSISSTMTAVATIAGTVEDKRSPTGSGTTGTTPSSPPKAEPTSIPETKPAVDATSPPARPKATVPTSPPKGDVNAVAATTHDQKVAAVLDINAELLKYGSCPYSYSGSCLVDTLILLVEHASTFKLTT